MTFGIVTHKSFVNAWECDENVHLNVQFYWKRFGQAATIFQHSEDCKPQRWTGRHVRYHAELGMGVNTTVRSGWIAGDNVLVHQMYGANGSTLSATAIDNFDDTSVFESAIQATPENAIPKSIQAQPLLIENIDTLMTTRNGLLSHLSVITPHECDEDGVLLDENHISRFSDAAGHFWHHLGIERNWMNQNKLGSVAVEMKATRHALPRVGMIAEITSWVEKVREKTFTFHHQVRDRITDTALYSGAVTALMMDMETRKAVALPEMLREKVLPS